jgi:aminopeptidase N
MIRFYFSLCCLFICAACAAQSDDPVHPPDTYRNSDNHNYWKNRPPFPGYWQQDVHYVIKAELNDATDLIDGSEQLTYYNNSPDTLTFVYFHLYQNAFQPGSYLDDLTKNNGVTPHYGKHEKDTLGTVVDYVKNDGTDLKTKLDNTILKVYLSKPLYSGTSITFDIHFKTYYGTGDVRRRMKIFNAFGFKHYDGVQWFPKISVYDRKFGWTADQHLNREFYGDYGTYDVDLTLPNIYILEATGNL